MVRTKVKAAACVVEEVDAGLCQIHPIERRGVALGQIRAFFKQMKSEISSDCQSDFDTISTRAVVKDFLEKRYGKTAYAEKVNEGPTCAKYVIEHLWDGRHWLCTIICRFIHCIVDKDVVKKLGGGSLNFRV